MTPSASINGSPYPQLPPEFMDDIVAELARRASGSPADVLPTAERTFPQSFKVTKDIRGLGFRTLAGPARVIASFAYLRPDGTMRTIDATVPEEQRAQLAGASLKGDEMVDAVYAAALPEVLKAFNTDWGV